MQKIHARQTIVKAIENSIADNFIAEHHRDGLPTFGKNRYNNALYHKNELVAVAAFSNPRTNAKKREYQHELVRLAFKKDIRIPGGASKLIKAYIKDVNPKNFFTYQTQAGENTDVYALSGMKLRSKGKPKKWLVKNGYTAETAKTTKEKYTYLNSQLVNLGPDQILGTNIGEKYENNKRLTNEQLFIRYCDYHIEWVAGDDVYEYENPSFTHYIYKITSSNPEDRRYYIGRHSVESSKLSSENELIFDSYIGSGGKAFQKWLEEIKQTGCVPVKSILKISTSFRNNIKDEDLILGDKYETDENCLNTVKGGIVLPSSFFMLKATKKECLKHGWTLHRGIHCLKCLAAKPMKTTECSVHGETLHRKKQCLKCASEKGIHKDICNVHGMVTFNGSTCLKCQNQNIHQIKACDIHGETIFKNNSCAKCTVEKGIKHKKCPTHGLTKHRGNQCLTCQVQSSEIIQRNCPIHGKTKFKKDTCLKCSGKRQLKKCPKHGFVKFHGDNCVTCQNEKQFTTQECIIHGMTKFRANTCCKCSRLKHIPLVTEKYCNTCQATQKHFDNECSICIEHKKKNLFVCGSHGLTKHKNGICIKCKKENSTTRQYCKICKKEARHIHGKCMSCSEQALYKELNCPIHGLTKHRGKTCCKCRSEQQKLKRQLKKKK